MGLFEKPFDAAEYARRLADTKRRMEEVGLDLIVCTDPANMCWLTGFDGWSFYVPQAVLVHLEADSPIWFGRAQDAKAAVVTTDLGRRGHRALFGTVGASPERASVR